MRNRAGLFAAASLLLAACASDEGAGSDPEHRGETGGLVDSDRREGRQIVKAVSSYGGSPIAGVQIQLDDGAWVTTDASGEASFPARPGPFTLTARQRAPGHPAAVSDVWRLVEQTDNPLVLAVNGGAAPLLSSLATGSVTGRRGGNDSVVRVYALTGRGEAGSAIAVDDFFQLFVHAEGQGTRKVTLVALETNAAATRFLGYGAAEIQISSGATVSTAIALAPVAETRVTGTLTPPAGGGTLAPQARLLFEDLDSSSDASDDLAPDLSAAPAVRLFQPAPTIQPGAYALDLPVIAGARLEVGFSSTTPGADLTQRISHAARQVDVPARDLAFALPAQVELIEPAAGAQVASSAPFRWRPVADDLAGDGKYVLSAACAAGLGSAPIYFHMIETRAPQTALPALDGLSLAGYRCHWKVAWLDVPAARGLAARALPEQARLTWSGQRLVVLR